MVKISDFQTKDVVSVNDGKRLGHIGDIDINLSSGKIESIIISGQGKILGLFGREEEVVVPWRSIVKVGTDVILVRMQQSIE
ncbi:YlmC/YmxH family sporulation protein [Fredinandcohnia quinoae]|uniref:YlmC/YmxH family sporulation protein n=1 Tax=Fredinandcohnia quinoae TaxID=2918902 RepID=A0AAW5DUZ9_9BACI|nr:YlmC/YmxH family sporulation protein [Fredinandcohnia sp. SECRCQ15]MCH1623863.1 YlmC/YmxH family sporulation protein [Fredinandcohnia sp. SECRCQ15]